MTSFFDIYRAIVCSDRTNVVQSSKMHFVFKATLGVLSVIIGFWARQSNGKWAGLEGRELEGGGNLLLRGSTPQVSHSVPMGS